MKTKKWTPEDKVKVAELMKEGLSAGMICKSFGVTRNSICGLVMRDKTLTAIGLRGRGGGGKPRRFTDEQRKENARRSAREYYHRKKRLRKAAQPQAANDSAPALRVVSNNVPLLIEDWLKRNGARKFERGLSSDPFAIKAYLAERGVKVDNYQGKWRMSTNSGRMRYVAIGDVYALADRFRSAEGLTPILRRAS